jgi:hypothetical protein
MESTTNFNDFKEEAIPLIKFHTSDKKFSINEDAENILRKIEGPIGVVSVAGMYRTGKSYLLNRMLLNRSSGFSVGPSINPCTKGLWIWSKPIKGYSPDGTPLNVLIIDTEGIGATDEDQNHDSKIFTLGILLSSFFVYNSLNSIDENAIQNLSFIVNITRNIQLTSQREDVDPKDYAAFLPSFMWVIRDFSLQLKNPDGEAISAREYLEKCLESQKGFSDSIEQKNKIRNLLRDFFKERDCVTLVRPLTDEENLQNLERMELSKLRPEFSEQVLNLRKKVLHKIKPKTLKGQVLNGEMFCNMMSSYVKAINSGAVPVIENAWSFMCKNECYKAMKNAIATYEKMMNENFVKKMPLKEEDLMRLHKEAKEKALEEYTRFAIGNFIDEFLQKFKDDMRDKMSNYKTTNEKECERLCNAFISKHYAEIEKNLKQGAYKNYTDYKMQIEEFINFYNDNAPQGPGRANYLNNFIIKNIFESSEAFIKKYLNEIEISCSYNSENIKKLNSELSELKSELNKEINKKNDWIKKYENEINELQSSDKSAKESLASLMKEKEQITRDLNEKLENLRKENEKQTNDLKNKLSNSEDALRETERRLITAESEFEKQRLLLEQKIKFSEKNYEELKEKEKEYTNEVKSIKKDRESFSKENKEKFESQIKAISKKLEEAHEKNIDLETKLLDKEKRRAFDKIKNDELITDFHKKIEDLNQLINASEDEIKISESKNAEEIEKLKNEQKLKIEEIALAKEELENKLKESESKLMEIRNKLIKENSLIKQNFELTESNFKEFKAQSEEEKQSFQAMIRLLEDKNQHAINSQEGYIKQINEIKSDYFNEIRKIETENEKTRQRLNAEIEEAKGKLNEAHNQMRSDNEDFERLNASNAERIQNLEETKAKLEEKLESIEESSTKDISTWKDKYEALDKTSHEKLEEILKKTRLETEENNIKNEKIINDMKKYFEAEKADAEFKLCEQRTKMHRKFEEQEIIFTENYKELEKTKYSIIEELTEQKEVIEHEHQNYVIQSQLDMSSAHQQIESLNRFLNDQKESFSRIQISHKENLELQIDSYNKEKAMLNDKIERIEENLNKKERENAVLTVKKEHLENDLAKLIKKTESHKIEFDLERKALEEKYNKLQAKYEQQYDELLLKKGDFSREMALNQQEIEFQSRKISDLQASLDNLNGKYDEKIKAFRETLEAEFLEKIDNLTKEKEEIEGRLNQKKKEYKELDLEYSKDKSWLEKEKAVLTEKLLSVSKQKDELMDSIEKEREYFIKQIQEIKESNKNQNSIQLKENEFLKNRVSKLEADNNDLMSNYDNDRNLWKAKNDFLEEKLNKTKMDLMEYMKKYELTIENMQKTGLMEKDKFENWQNLIVTQLEERYSNQLKEYKDMLSKNYGEVFNKKKELEFEVKILQEKLLTEQKAKMIDQGELGKKLSLTIDSEARLKKRLEETILSRDFKLREMIMISEKEREMHKGKIIELENKLREYESKRNNLAVDNMKDKVGYDKEKELWQTDIERLNEKNRNMDRNMLKLTSDNKELLRENDRLKKENRQYKSNSSLYAPKYTRYSNTGNKENRNHSNGSFDRNFEGMELINNLSNTNINVIKSRLAAEKSQKSEDDNFSTISNNEKI